jgi:hypothetical protein
MNRNKILSVLTSSVMCTTFLGMDTYAVLEPDDYVSVCNDLDNEVLLNWNEGLLNTLKRRGINADESSVVFSDPYYCYNFYNMEIVEDSYYRIVFDNEDIIGVSYGSIEGNKAYVQWSPGEFDYLSESLKNDSKILFGAAVVEHFSCSLIYSGGAFYSYNSIVFEEGKTDLIFGEIPYSQLCEGDVPDDVESTTVSTTNEATMPYVKPENYIAGDVNMDDKVSLLDLVMLERINIGVIRANDAQMTNADCFKDGIVDFDDTQALICFLVEKIDFLPIMPE